LNCWQGNQEQKEQRSQSRNTVRASIHAARYEEPTRAGIARPVNMKQEPVLGRAAATLKQKPAHRKSKIQDQNRTSGRGHGCEHQLLGRPAVLRTEDRTTRIGERSGRLALLAGARHQGRRKMGVGMKIIRPMNHWH
jgi:hypothetical protein